MWAPYYYLSALHLVARFETCGLAMQAGGEEGVFLSIFPKIFHKFSLMRNRYLSSTLFRSISHELCTTIQLVLKNQPTSG